VSALIVGLFAWTAPARAQVPPEAAPVLEIVAPIVSPVCGDAVLVVVLAPGLISGQLGSPLPVEIAPVLGPAVAVCGSVPVPGQRLKCAPDDTVRGALDTISGTAAGTPLPIDTSIIAPLVGTTFAVQDKLPAPANTAGLAELVASTLTCTVVAAPTEPEAEPAAEETASEEALEDLFALEDLPALEELPPIDSEVAGAEFGSSAGPELQSAIADGAYGFAYPVVLILPLLVLVLGAYLGRTLTRSVAAPQKH
jgi:hypothetical protein